MTDPTATLAALLQQAYAQAREQLPGQEEMVLLHLGAQRSGLAMGKGAQPETVTAFDLGLAHLAERYFKTEPPSPLAMENAIMVVEDLVMPLRATLPPAARLVSTDPLLLQWARLSLASEVPHDVSQGPLVLSLQAMEHSFNRLVHVTEGRPAAQEGLPTAPLSVAALLVLRECMHHWQFEAITLLQGPA